MSHRTIARHAAPRGRRRASVPPVVFAAAAPGADTGAGINLSLSSMTVRPGMPYQDTLLGRTPEPGEQLGEFRIGRTARVVIGDKPELGRTGRVVRIVPFRKNRPIGVRLDGDGWGPISWYDEFELQVLPELADTAELAAAGPAVSE